MNLVDSSGWLEFLANSRNASFFASALEDTASLLVSTVNIYEVFKACSSSWGRCGFSRRSP
jgi:uncharacterized protein with PIN domain